MADKVMCPYCPEGAEMFPTYSEGGVIKWACRCGSESPVVVRKPDESRDDAVERARILALRRADPPNRALTLEEVKTSICDCIGASHAWVEYKGGDVFACLVNVLPYLFAIIDADNVCNYEFHSEYGKSYRIWSTIPSDEERKAVPWNG